MDPIIEQHREQQEELVADSTTLMAAAEAEKRDLTEEELGKVQANTVEFDRLKGLIETRDAVLAQTAELDRPQGRLTEPDDLGTEEDGDDDDDAGEMNVRPSAKAKHRPRAKVIGQRSSSTETSTACRRPRSFPAPPSMAGAGSGSERATTPVSTRGPAGRRAAPTRTATTITRTCPCQTSATRNVGTTWRKPPGFTARPARSSGPTTTPSQADYVRFFNLGGLMFWEVSGDDDGILIEALHHGLKVAGPPTSDPCQ